MAEAFHELDIEAHSDIAEFYSRFWGPFVSRRLGVELLDMAEQQESVLSATLAGRAVHGFPKRYLVVSSLNAGSVIVYDRIEAGVYEVDFEGGEEELLAGVLQPRWPNWNDFLADFFA